MAVKVDECSLGFTNSPCHFQLIMKILHWRYASVRRPLSRLLPSVQAELTVCLERKWEIRLDWVIRGDARKMREKLARNDCILLENTSRVPLQKKAITVERKIQQRSIFQETSHWLTCTDCTFKSARRRKSCPSKRAFIAMFSWLSLISGSRNRVQIPAKPVRSWKWRSRLQMMRQRKTIWNETWNYTTGKQRLLEKLWTLTRKWHQWRKIQCAYVLTCNRHSTHPSSQLGKPSISDSLTPTTLQSSTMSRWKQQCLFGTSLKAREEQTRLPVACWSILKQFRDQLSASFYGLMDVVARTRTTSFSYYGCISFNRTDSFLLSTSFQKLVTPTCRVIGALDTSNKRSGRQTTFIRLMNGWNSFRRADQRSDFKSSD